MAQVRKMSNVAVAMQSALGANKTITAISLAAPGVVTCTHDFANGDYVLMTVNGMYQLNGKVFRVVNVSTTVSFQLEDVTGGTGISTVGFAAFSSGTANKITFGTSITSAAALTASGGDFAYLDTTTIHTNQKSQIPGAANPISFEMEHLWDITDAGQIAMKNASDLQSQLAFKLTYGTGGPIQVFTGYVGYTGAPTGAAQDILKSKASITAFGSPTYYSA
jgi:hypothetical protein